LHLFGNFRFLLFLCDMKNIVIIITSIIALSSCGKKEKYQEIKPIKSEVSVYSDMYVDALAHARAYKDMANMQVTNEKKLEYLYQSKFYYESAELYKSKLDSIKQF
jgi:hypothetical protein